MRVIVRSAGGGQATAINGSTVLLLNKTGAPFLAVQELGNQHAVIVGEYEAETLQQIANELNFTESHNDGDDG